MTENKEKIENIIRFSPNYLEGLSSDQVKYYIEKGQINTIDDKQEKTNIEIIKENTFTYFNLIFLVLAVLITISGSYKNLTFVPVVVINTLIGIIQEIRAKKVLEKMHMLHQSEVTVVRDGKKKKIRTEELVLDDIVVFKTGDQICADAIVVKDSVKVNESLLTGESDEIEKSTNDTLMSGSFVVSGTCYARLEKVGNYSYISQLTKEAKKIDHTENSEMIKSLNVLLKIVGIILIPVGILLFIQSYLINKNGFQQSIVAMVAAVIGMVPEGLYLLTTISLAISTMKLAQQQVLLHDMKSIESLARVNVLCVDKTGTITENEMSVKQLIPLDQNFLGSVDDLALLIGDFVSYMDNDNDTMKALKSHFKKLAGNKPLSKTSFSSEFKYSSATFENGTFVLGAPEFILRNDYTFYEDEIEKHTAKGNRVLLFGLYNGSIDGRQLTQNTKPLGLIILTNKIRKNAKKTFTYFYEQNVSIKVISGDNPMTVSRVATEAGIKGASRYVDASMLKTKEDVYNAVKQYTVFGRVTPEQKRLFIQCLQAQGNKVAMTGDGVNDILALKDADCSIAMASGSDAATHASQVVLLNSDFSKLPEVVLEGRRVINNIQRSASLFLVKNIFSLIMAILTIVFSVTYPLEPSNISLISMFTIGIPGYFLALEKNNSRIEGHFMNNVLIKALPGGLTNVFIVGVLVACREIFGLPANDVSTASTLLLALVGFIVLINISKPLNKYRLIVVAGNFISLILCSVFLNELFSLKMMSKICILMFVTLAFTAESFFRFINNVVNIISRIEIKFK